MRTEFPERETVVPIRDGRPLIVVSDVHLGAVPDATERALRRFLAELPQMGSALLINGDLFDAWLATRHLVVRRHVRTLAALADLVDAGVPVYFVGGNHDAHEFGGDALRDCGVTLLDDPARLRFGGHRVLVAHGDGVRPGRATYRKQHPLLRSPVVRWTVERLLHPDRIVSLIMRASGTPGYARRYAQGEGTGPKPAAPHVEAWARDALRALPDVNLVLAGHSHLPAHECVAPGRHYLNTGDWIEHMTYAVLPVDAAPRLEVWHRA